MNPELKKGILYRDVMKNRRKFLIILIVLIALFVRYTVAIMPLLQKLATGPSEFSAENFAAETGFAERIPESDDDDELFAIQNEKIYGYAVSELTYRQGTKYYFRVPISGVEPSGLEFTMSGEIVGEYTDTDSDPVAVRVWYIDIGGKKTAVLAADRTELENGKAVSGIFVKMPTVISDALFDAGLPEGAICDYMLDVRGIRMDSEFSDSLIWVLFLLALIYLVFRLGLYYVNPLHHPTYRQLGKYGDVAEIAADVEYQLANGITEREKGRVYTHDWIVADAQFRKIIEKNFIAGGSFKYTPGKN